MTRSHPLGLMDAYARASNSHPFFLWIRPRNKMKRRPLNSGNRLKKASRCASTSAGGSAAPSLTNSCARHTAPNARGARVISPSLVKSTARAFRVMRFSMASQYSRFFKLRFQSLEIHKSSIPWGNK